VPGIIFGGLLGLLAEGGLSPQRMEGRRKQQEKIVVNDASIDNLRSVLKAAQNGETQSAARKEKKNEGVREREEKDKVGKRTK
jgi:hypothetical protein